VDADWWGWEFLSVDLTFVFDMEVVEAMSIADNRQ
jgi:hypothetical protein